MVPSHPKQTPWRRGRRGVTVIACWLANMLLATVAHFNMVVWVWFMCDTFSPSLSVYKSLFTVEG